MQQISGSSLPILYAETIDVMRVCAIKEDTMRGKVLSMTIPTFLRLENPTERVLFDAVRNANPFFHVMEFIWMMAGGRSVNWIKQFNSNYAKSADKNGLVNGAYGYRWIRHFGVNQIVEIIKIFEKAPNSRRAILAMWDPTDDLGTEHNDYPCNTHIYFRIQHGMLEMTVCNRSNDVIWGALGANVVHMTMLQEIIAAELKIEIGCYQVFTNNLHIYEDMPNFKNIFDGGTIRDDRYPLEHSRLMSDVSLAQFLLDCEAFVGGYWNNIKSHWLLATARPIYLSYMERKDKSSGGVAHANQIEASDWRIACTEWIQRKNSSLLISTEPLLTTPTEPTF